MFQLTEVKVPEKHSRKKAVFAAIYEVGFWPQCVSGRQFFFALLKEFLHPTNSN